MAITMSEEGLELIRVLSLFMRAMFSFIICFVKSVNQLIYALQVFIYQRHLEGR